MKNPLMEQNYLLVVLVLIQTVIVRQGPPFFDKNAGSNILYMILLNNVLSI